MRIADNPWEPPYYRFGASEVTCAERKSIQVMSLEGSSRN